MPVVAEEPALAALLRPLLAIYGGLVAAPVGVDRPQPIVAQALGQPEPELARKYLDAAKSYIPFYQKLIGAYKIDGRRLFDPWRG